MGKYSWSKFDFNKLVPVIEKAGSGLKKAGKVVGEVVKDRNFQIGALASLPASVGAFFLIRRYKKALAKHNAVIKELDSKAELDRERQDRLLAYDTALKKEMTSVRDSRS